MKVATIQSDLISPANVLTVFQSPKISGLKTAPRDFSPLQLPPPFSHAFFRLVVEEETVKNFPYGGYDALSRGARTRIRKDADLHMFYKKLVFSTTLSV